MADIDINTLAKLIKEGKVTPTKLPEQVYHVNADKIVKGIYEGYGKTLKDVVYDSPDFRMLNSLRENAYMFSAAKTFQETLQMTEALTDGDKVVSFSEFKESVASISNTFNENYLATEYNTAIASAQNASSWERIQEDKNVLPYLKYQTIGDACDICEPLDNVVLPVDDPFWNNFYPPNHFNCRCLCDSLENNFGATSDATKSDLESEVGKLMDDTFKMNSGKLGEVFSEDHPYFIVPPEYKEFAANNFGLEIPEATGMIPAEIQTLEQMYPNLKVTFRGDQALIDEMEKNNKVIEHIQSAGIPKDIVGDIKIRYNSRNSIEIYFDGSGVKMDRTIDLVKNDIHNDYFRIKPDSRYKGQGAEIFKGQVDNASKFGFKEIKTYGAGYYGSGEYNGYYTWARLGYAPERDTLNIRSILIDFQKQTGVKADFMEMMATKEGQELWKLKGSGTDYVFDLSKNSPNQVRLQNYINEKKGK